MTKTAKKKNDMPSFTRQDRPEKVKDIYRALKKEHPDMPAEMKARIAARQGKPGKQKQGPPYKGPIKERYKGAEELKEAFFGLFGKKEKKVEPTFPREHLEMLAEKYNMMPEFVINDVATPDVTDPEILEHNIAAWSDAQRLGGGPGVEWDEKRWGKPNPLAGVAGPPEQLDKGAFHKDALLKAVEKTAIIGPIGEIGSLGIPSLAGYFLGKEYGGPLARAGEERPSGVRLKDLLGLAMIPGYTGFQLGQRGAYDEEMRRMAQKEKLPEEGKTASADVHRVIRLGLALKDHL